MIYLIYKTDNAHSYNSRDIIGALTSYANVIPIIQQQVEKEGEQLSSDDLHNLANIKQTQNYGGEGEFQIEEIETDTLL